MRSLRRFLNNIFRKDNKVGCLASPPTISTPSTSVCVLDYVDIKTQYAEDQQQSERRIEEITPILSLSSWSLESLSSATADQDEWEDRIFSLGEMKALGFFSFKTGMKYRARDLIRKKFDSLFGYQLLCNEEY